MPEKVTVEPMDHSKKNSPIARPVEDQSTVLMSTASRTCFWNGEEFSESDQIECKGKTYECNLGHWVQEN